MRHSEVENTDPEIADYVRRLRCLYLHLTYYAVVHLGLAALNWPVTPGQPWVVWSLVGWRIGLSVHAVQVVAADRWYCPAWEARTIERLQRKDSRNA